MAYAQLAGLPPIHGLYASFLPVAIGALFGSSRQLATGPVAISSLLTATAIAPLAVHNPEAIPALAALLALLAGVLRIAMGVLRLGVVVDFLSVPVVVGFTNAAAIIIASSQLDKLLGVNAISGAHHYQTVWHVLSAAYHQVHWATVGMGALALAIIFGLRKLAPKAPGVLAAVAVTTLLSWWAHYGQWGGRVVGTIPMGLPSVALPTLDPAAMLGLLQGAVIVTLMGLLEAISSAKAIAARTRQRWDANQELIGQGLANVSASFLQGYPVSGSFSRSAVNFNTGAITGFSSVVTTVIVAVTLLWLTPLLYHLPQATLAAVIMMAVASLIKVAPLTHAWRIQKQDASVGVIVFFLTLMTAPHLEWGILAGIILSLGLYVFRRMRPRMVVLSRHSDGTLRDASAHILETCPSISVLRFDGSLIFVNASYFESKVLETVASNPELRFIVIDAESMNEIDSSGEEMLHLMASRLYASGTELLFARVKKQVMDPLIRARFVKQLGEDHFFRTRTLALQYAWDRLGPKHEETCPLKTA
jgi:sulfate permease, SulP family